MNAQEDGKVLAVEEELAPGFPRLIAWIQRRIAPETLQSFGERTGITASQFSRWKKGAHTPNIDSLRRVAEGLDVPLLQVLVTAGILTEEETAADLPDLGPSQLRPEDLVLMDPNIDPKAKDFILNAIEMARGRPYHRGPKSRHDLDS